MPGVVKTDKTEHVCTGVDYLDYAVMFYHSRKRFPRTFGFANLASKITLVIQFIAWENSIKGCVRASQDKPGLMKFELTTSYDVLVPPRFSTVVVRLMRYAEVPGSNPRLGGGIFR